MKYNTYYEGATYGFGLGMTRGIRYILIASVASFLIDSILRMTGHGFWVNAFGLTPALVQHNFFFWQFASYMFVHGGLWHLLFNMFALWMFGTEIERSWGTREFLIFFFLTGICVGLIHWVFSSLIPFTHLTGSPNQTLIGASGAVFAILAAYGMMFPERTILFMFIFPMKVKWFVLMLAGIEFYLIWAPSGIAHFAHVSGLLLGWLYLKKDWNISGMIDRARDRRRRRHLRVVRENEQSLLQESEEVDRILDKINRQGIGSLSRHERKILQKASERGRK